MVNFGYPYNDLVICKDSTDYLTLWEIHGGDHFKFKNQCHFQYDTTKSLWGYSQ